MGLYTLTMGSKAAAWELRELLVFDSQLAGGTQNASRVPRHTCSAHSRTCQRRTGMTGSRSLVTPSKISNGTTESAHRTSFPKVPFETETGCLVACVGVASGWPMPVHLTIGSIAGGGGSALAGFPTAAGKRKLCRLSGPQIAHTHRSGTPGDSIGNRARTHGCF